MTITLISNLDENCLPTNLLKTLFQFTAVLELCWITTEGNRTFPNVKQLLLFQTVAGDTTNQAGLN